MIRRARPKRKIMLHADVALVPLPGGFMAIIDPGDAALAQWHNWYAYKSGRGDIYAYRDFQVERYARKRIPLHRSILELADHQLIEFVNGDTLDCRRSNMRLTTRALQNHLRSKEKNSRTGYIGVSRYDGRHGGGFRADIAGSYVGVFSSAVDAAHAYDHEAKRLYGPAAWLNFPEE
jgi:hypothetical protein